jgi:hypothetical protein
MQVNNNLNYTTPSFTALRSVKYKGLYKTKYSELNKELINVFKQNPEVKELCKTHDVDVVFNSRTIKGEGTISSVHVKYEKPKTETKLDKVKNLFKNAKEIAFGRYEDAGHEDASILLSTDKLINSMLPFEEKAPSNTGILSEKIARVLNKEI